MYNKKPRALLDELDVPLAVLKPLLETSTAALMLPSTPLRLLSSNAVRHARNMACLSANAQSSLLQYTLLFDIGSYVIDFKNMITAYKAAIAIAIANVNT